MKTQNLVFGRSSGSIGNVVASALYGENIVRSKPLEVYNPRTLRQTNMRTIMADVVKIAKTANQYLAITKRTARTGRSKKMSAYAYLIKDILAAKTGSTPNIALQPAGITLGTGDMEPTSVISVIIDKSDASYIAQWINGSSGNQDPSDLATVILLNLTNGKVIVSALGAERTHGNISDSIPADFCILSDQVAAFVAFDDQNGTIWDAPISVAATIQA